MNYKEKKYILQDKWLNQNLTKLDFFAIAHTKSCNSSEWVNFQKDLSKLNLKIKSINFRNVSNLELFSKLPCETVKALFKGKLIIIYNNDFKTPSGDVINKLQNLLVLRLFLLYSQGRFLNIVSKSELKNVSIIEWDNILQQLGGGFQLYDILENSRSSYVNVLQHQHKMILSLLMNRVENESKF